MPVPTLKDIGVFKSISGKGYLETTSTGAPTADLTKIVSNLLAIITIIAGVGFLFYFIFGAVNWITSGGDAQKAAAARNTILNALIGLVVTVIAYPAILLIAKLIGIPLADPEELFTQLFK